VIACLASQYSVDTARIEVWRYDEKDPPRPYNLQKYLVLENFTRRVNLPMFAERASTKDSPNLRKHLRERRRLEKLAPRDHPFSSFFSSLRKRQSVPWAMIFCGLLVIIPISWRRRAKKRTVASGSYSRHRLYGISLSV